MDLKSYTTLTRIIGIINGRRKRLGAGHILRVFIVLAAVHLMSAGVLGFLHTLFPFNPVILYLMSGWFLGYSALPVLIFIQWKNKNKIIGRIARELDGINKGSLDVFQTCLSLENHSDETLLHLNKLYTKELSDLKMSSDRLLPVFSLGILGLGLAFWLTLGWLSDDFRGYLNAGINPLGRLASIPRLEISIVPEKSAAGKGDTVSFAGELTNYSEGQRVYAIVNERNSITRFPVRINGAGILFSTGPVENDFEIYFWADNGKSPTVKISVFDPPYISNIQAVAVPPSYTGLPPDTLPAGTTNIFALPGSRVKWFLTADRYLNSLVWNSITDIKAENVTVIQDSLGSGIKFVLEKQIFGTGSSSNEEKKNAVRAPFTYSFAMEDENRISGRYPVRSSVELLEDKAPGIEILLPENNSRIDKNQKIEVALLASDDYGISKMVLNYKLESDGFLKDSNRINVSEWLKNSHAGYIKSVWDLNFMDLRPDNVVHFSFRVCDNNNVSGSKCAESEWRTIRFASIEEIIAESREKEEHARSLLKSAFQRQKKVAEKIEQINPKNDQINFDLSAYEIKKVLVADPRFNYTRGKELLEQLKKRTGSNSSVSERADNSEIKAAEKSMEKYLKSLPEKGIELKTPVVQLEALQKLSRAQQDLRRECSPLKRAEDARDKRVTEYDHRLEQGINKQEELKDYLSSQLKQQERQEAIKEQLLTEQSRVLEDMKQSMDELKSYMEKSIQNDLFSGDMLEKLERIQELLKEAMPDSLMNMLKMKMEGENVDAADINRNLRDIMNNRESFEQNIDRALAMLEKMHERKQIEDWKYQFSGLQKEELEIQKSINGTEEKNRSSASMALGRRQESIKSSMEQILEEIKQSTRDNSGRKKMYEKLMSQKTADEMKNVMKNLEKDGSREFKAASNSAGVAARKLEAMMDILSENSENSISMDLDNIQRLLLESLELSRLHNTMRSGQNIRHNNGWQSSPSEIYEYCNQVSKWLNREIKSMSSQNPFISSYLLTQSRLLADSFKEKNGLKHDVYIKTQKYNQNVSRELLKLYNFAKSLPSGSGSSQCGGQSGEPGSRDQGAEQQGLAERLGGMSGQQLAINQATSQLLKAMLEGRKSRKSTGSEGQGITAQSLANTQGELGEKIEGMAEHAGDEGGAAQKLRRLAEEARKLESELRRGKVTAKTLENQEKFKSELLNASRSIRERGYSNLREGREGNITGNASEKTELFKKSEWLRRIENEKKRIDKLDADRLPKKKLDEYFKSLLVR